MTPRSFILAKISLERLLDNVIERDPNYSSFPVIVKKSIEEQDDCIALCTEKQASLIARSIVYKCIGDDLDLYPISAEQKIQKSKARGESVCTIPFDELTDEDIKYVTYASAKGENISQKTMTPIFEWFKEFDFDSFQARVYCTLYYSNKPLNISAIPKAAMFYAEYRKAAESLVEQGYLKKNSTNEYEIVEL